MTRDPLSRFQDVVRDHPHRTAVRDVNGKLTFAELDGEVSRLASVLIGHGVRRGDRVGVCLPRGNGLVAALLAVWRAGAAYVPLDPAYPADRLAFMADDAGLRAVVAEHEPEWLPDGASAVSPGQQPAQAVESWPEPDNMAQDPAYVIYTSGSTGRPKGVQIRRAQVSLLTEALDSSGMYAVAPRVVAWNASVSFDASVQQWARVCRGDVIVILDEEHRKEPARLAAWLDECAVSDLDMTPSHWELLREDLLARTAGPRLRLFIGGEAVSPAAWLEIEKACSEGQIEALNLYGPTECTVDATATWFEGSGPHIGGPLAGNRLYVLDETLNLVADGVAGELYIAGPRVGDGYLGRTALTAQRFVADPFGEAGERMYRTGDEVRRAADGSLEFLGRTDRQVKLRGYRVELGEIESVLRAHPAVAAAATVVRADGPGGERLIAYYVPANWVDPVQLREHMAAALPDFMVPTGFVEMDALPLTVNGKLDTAALPAPAAASAEDWTGTDPVGEFEELIAGVWSEVLGLDRVSADDDFFALGGHSLIALRVVARLKKNLGVAMSPKEVYRHPQLSELARRVESLSTVGSVG